MGFNVACVEGRGRLGGTCLNVGCIPSKVTFNISWAIHACSFFCVSLEGMSPSSLSNS